MKKIFQLLFFSIFLPLKAYSLDTSVRGFIALDALNYEKIQREKGSAVIGIGVLDMKLYAEQDDMMATIKLDLDGKLEQANNIFEEAFATYKGFKDWRITLGKGVVRFQNLHWGAVENTYQDGGTVIASDNLYRKLSKKAFIAASYGGKSFGFINQFTVWGDSTEYKYSQEGKLEYSTKGSTSPKEITGYQTENVKAFSTRKQLGLANKLEMFISDELKFSFGQVYYKSKFQEKANYAVDFGVNFENAAMEIWLDALYGFSSKLPYDFNSTKARTEYFLQLGAEYYLDEKWSVIGNMEGLYFKDLAHQYVSFTEGTITYNPSNDLLETSGVTVRSTTYKLESALKYKLSKSSQITFGGLYEKKIASKNRVKDLSFIRGFKNVNAEAFKLASSVSFWF